MWFDSYNYVVEKYNQIDYHHHIKLLRRGIFFDTAPLFILVVGHYDKIHGTRYIEQFQSHDKKKKKEYKSYDYTYLIAFLNSLGLGSYNLFITPHIFTEFIKHLWVIVEDSDKFTDILKDYFCQKWYIKELNIECLHCINEANFLDKTLEIGDISITMTAKNSKHYLGILTDDEPFAVISNTKYDLLSVYYDDIRRATYELDSKNIPKELLKEPIPLPS